MCSSGTIPSPARTAARWPPVSKEPFRWTDTYVLDITDPKELLYVLMFVLAFDAEKCSRN